MFELFTNFFTYEEKKMGLRKPGTEIGNWDGAWVSDPHSTVESVLAYANVHYELGYTAKLLAEKDIFETMIYDKVK